MAEMVIPSEDETARLCAIGRTIYETQLKAILEPEYNGKMVAIHLDSGDYAIASNSPYARRDLRVRKPTGLIFVTDIGLAPIDGLTWRMMGSQILSGRGK